MGQFDLPSETDELSIDPFDLSNVNLEGYSLATAQPTLTHRLPPIFYVPTGKVFTPPYVPPESLLPHRYIEPADQNHASQRRYRNMIERGIFELGKYTLPVCSNGRLWKPAFYDALKTDQLGRSTTYY